MKLFAFIHAPLLALLFALPVHAGPVTAEGYSTSGDGIYWNAAGQPFVKKWWKNWYTAYSTSGYGCYSCQVPYSTYYWSYTYEPVNLPKAASYEQRRQFLLGLAKSRQDSQNAREKSAQEHVQEMEFARSLGLYFPTSEGFARSYLSPTMPGFSYGASQIGSLGQTAYGSYTFNTTSDVYGRLDPNIALQQASMLTQNAQNLGGGAFKQLVDWVNQDGARAADLAKAVVQAQGRTAVGRAAGDAAAKALRAAQPVESHSSTTVTATVPTVMPPADPPLVGPPAPPAPLPPVPQPQVSAAALNCVQCHSAKKPQGGFNFESWNPVTASDAEYARVEAYVAANAPADKRCPKNGPALTTGQRRKLFGK